MPIIIIDDIVSSRDLLRLLERMDKVLEIYGGTRRNERVVAVAIQNSLFPFVRFMTPFMLGNYGIAL